MEGTSLPHQPTPFGRIRWRLLLPGATVRSIKSFPISRRGARPPQPSAKRGTRLLGMGIIQGEAASRSIYLGVIAWQMATIIRNLPSGNAGPRRLPSDLINEACVIRHAQSSHFARRMAAPAPAPSGPNALRAMNMSDVQPSRIRRCGYYVYCSQGPHCPCIHPTMYSQLPFRTR